MKQVKGFSKLSKEEKINWLTENYFSNAQKTKETLKLYWNKDEKLQKLHDEFTENTISNYYLPFGVAPNFLINEQLYTIPMAIEESSVVAAASNAAKFWFDKGGFKAEVLSTQKVGQVHFNSTADFQKLKEFFKQVKPKLIEEVKAITKNMEKRGGGISSIELRNKTQELANYYQLHCTFETLDAMGANFINSCLEQIAETFTREAENYFTTEEQPEIIMSILSNYVPECLVRAEVSCPVEELLPNITDARKFAHKFVEAVKIAKIEPYRAVTHNKGIMNGIDAVVLATGNDFRAIEAGVHAYAAKDGSYSSLTDASVENGMFKFWMEVPLALGTVGGLTSLHPLVKLALEMLQKPSAKELMQIVAVAGLAQNFAALRSLTTTGIQQGHMKMHLMNILNQFEANESERQQVIEHFKSNTVSHSAVVEIIQGLRNEN
ncbi:MULTISPECIES: hydroxymethylglutaryl-CoA reductase, degradative [Mesonia]|uniref:3-hydroxy-3-methylglutaryl-coenzyme A reductase n=1 Tax=Mesonia oceanica TaxID=2687242 RepID=A0AC61Y541_9FLAO|nr:MULTISPECIES: hydroxymethylglutaryl-CoA reductase, degradative [Mesonia]MAN28690.1 hydroxymethylglutaryl-CoA reductase, degradative [Mesonia sp.]MAQ41935.1 hydroxymethylglutaryl-CoA reductase, degradative [Mesonia sp.]MBJ99385.1 hydroxymethylglutaryl-CoA reductase, degradative [Flavobacteriaceae bacterium]VVU99613.1 3-hydroxy-3-methylglutaryl-coenzyme A reductase [Mesonia oceanica]|tara:strand:- start:9214 stop:10521 length:1308 start_codon:yes stop_codon:yes gene_type:complete